MEPIHLFSLGDWFDQRALQYSKGSSSSEGVTHRFAVKGEVSALMCPSCRRIVLYGEPYD
jgi:hypothetical protein